MLLQPTRRTWVYQEGVGRGGEERGKGRGEGGERRGGGHIEPTAPYTYVQYYQFIKRP